jgi:cephalosporin hydroxylase
MSKSPSPSRALTLARQQWERGDWESLLAWDQPELERHPDRGELLLLCARAYLELGNFEKYKLLAKKALKRGSSRADLVQLFSKKRPISLDYFIEKAPSDNSDLIEIIKNNLKSDILSENAATLSNPYAHNRTLTPSLNKDLRNFATEILSLERVKPSYIDYLALKAIDIERGCIGRLATTVQDAVARQLVAESLQHENSICILEIGALYGISLAILYNHMISRCSKVKIICLDPFDGYYGQAFDAQLNQPVNDRTFLRNMELSRVPESNFQVIKKYSTDPKAISVSSTLNFNLLIIDGDHSYEGVKFDFDNYFPHLLPGGFVIFDDYNAKEWPGVQKFIDEDLNQVRGLEKMGSISRTMVCRKAT